MGIGASFFYGKGKDSGDADVQFVDNRHPALNKMNTPKSHKSVDPAKTASELHIKALDMTPRERAAALGNVPTVTYVTRDKNSEPRASNYSPSPIKSSKTSPSSFKVNSETVLAYPSPTRLHSPIVSYTNTMNQISPTKRPVRYPSENLPSVESSPADDDSTDNKHQSPKFFYCNVPSPSWKPLSRQVDDDDRSPSLSPDRSWAFPSTRWSQVHANGRQSRKMEQMYYQDEDGVFIMRSPKEKRYF